MESPPKLHKRKEKIRLFGKVFIPLLKKNYSSPIKMSTRINRLSFEMLHCKGRSKNEDLRKN